MVSYYGSKSKIVKLYLPPTKDIIIEPFAGTARYSLMYWEKDVRLYDLNPNIITMWHYLQSATEKDLLSLPKLKRGDDLRNFDLSEGERCFLGFCVNEGSANQYVIKKANEMNLVYGYDDEGFAYGHDDNESPYRTEIFIFSIA